MSTQRQHATALTRREHLRLAEVLSRSAGNRQAVAPLSVLYPELTPDDAARIRDTTIVRRIARGEQLVGAKVSFGQLGAAGDGEPRLGWLTDAMLVSNGRVDIGELIRPRLEAKVAFVLREPLRGRIGGVTDLLAITERVHPCLEVLDARYEGADVGPLDDIADNCAISCLLVGDGVPTPAQAELLDVRVRLSSTTDGALARRRSPVRATLWLANRVIDEAGELDTGALLVSSACCPPVHLAPGQRVSADFGALGSLELQIA